MLNSLDSKSSVLGRAGSIPASSTIKPCKAAVLQGFLFNEKISKVWCIFTSLL